MRRKRISFQVGDVFAIPLRDGTFGLGQVAQRTRYETACALFPLRGSTPTELLSKLHELPRPLTILVLTEEELETGEWPILAHHPAHYAGLLIPTDGEGVSHTATAAPGLLAAYHGLAPWDAMHDPRYYEKLLIPGVPVPPTVRYKRDFAAWPPVPPAPPPSPPITEGPAALTIQIVYPGDGFPSIELLRKRQAMERLLEERGAGQVAGAAAGGGVMEIDLHTDDVRRAVPLVEAIADELGFKDDMLIETAPLDDDEAAAE